MMTANVELPQHLDGSEIAIIGLACRFPGAKNVEAFWKNLREGVESIGPLTEAELKASGVGASVFNDPHYVRAASVLDDVEGFDAAFFGYSPREAEFIDPQQRVFLECVWEALEHAGYDPEAYPGSIGVYAGAKTSSYLFNLFSNPNTFATLDITEVGLGNDLANLTTRVAYKLNLKGPSYSIHTACSTSLVAVHLACQSLLVDECQLALAGGVSINVPQKAGYRYQASGILSPDGHCRAFDAKAQGTIFGNGAGVVVLKRLGDALTDGDQIHALIRGSASNNDGALKASFTAPGVQGQAEVIAEALATARVKPETVTYVEAHGTGTTLGDSIELRALTKAFRSNPAKTGYCAIGSVKTNIGHLDTAAGISSLIKTVLALAHKEIPPSLYFEEPNPTIDFANSPFYVNTRLTPWPVHGAPRRAGVSSFGFGSANAHLVLEEAPAIEPSAQSRPWQLLALSARTSTALETATANLAQHLQHHPELNLADVAYTLNVGRRAFGQRRIALAPDLTEAVRALQAHDPHCVFTSAEAPRDRSVVFMFTGQGAQYVNMALDLYQSEPVFGAQLDRCAQLLQPHLGFDLRRVLYPSPADSAAAADALNQTDLTQPILFVVEYALAQLWLAWGVLPQAMIGHSLGEYVAACLAGVFSLEDALALVAARGRLMQSLPPGAMLAVPLPETELRARLPEQISLAAINGPGLCVVSGSTEAIEAWQRQLESEHLTCRRLNTSHAFHSAMMEPILADFTERVRQSHLNPPTLPYISNVTGTWITEAEATNPEYWAQQLRQAVRFDEGLGELLKAEDRILLEIGPGHTLSQLARRHPALSAAHSVLTSLGSAQTQASDRAAVLEALGRLWLAGVTIDWPEVYRPERRQRVALPTYPFERQRYWIDAQPQSLALAAAVNQLTKETDLAKWFYLPSWKRWPLPAQAERTDARRCWLVFVEGGGFGDRLADRLQAAGQRVTRVKPATDYGRVSEGVYHFNPQQLADYRKLASDLRAAGTWPEHILHLWNVTPEAEGPLTDSVFDQAQKRGLYSLLFLAQAIGQEELIDPLPITVIANHLHEVTGVETVRPEKATLAGPVKVIPQEYPKITCRSLDVIVPVTLAGQEALIDQLLAELNAAAQETTVAYRGPHRWVQTFEPFRLGGEGGCLPRLRERGVYVITGGWGGVGLVLANYLAQALQAKLILIGRSTLPKREAWPQWLADHPDDESLSRKIRAMQQLETFGAEVVCLSADVTNRAQMQAAIDQGRERFGDIQGVIHAAGVAGGGLVQLKTQEMVEAVLAPKTQGARVLEALFHAVPLDFLIYFSSLTAVVGEFGQVDYCAANAFLDAYAQQQQRTHPNRYVASINWDTWHAIGMAVDPTVPVEVRQMRERLIGEGILAAEGSEAFRRILGQSQAPQILVSIKDLRRRMETLQTLTQAFLAEALALTHRPAHPRPNLTSAYVAPRNEFEIQVAAIWQQVLGVEQVGVDDDFFQLGGHSLLITQLLNRLHKTYPVEVPIRSLFENPTVAGMAVVIAQLHQQAATQPVKPIRERLREAAPADRPNLLDAYVRQKIAQALGLSLDQLPADGDLQRLDIAAITSDLMWNFHQDFHLQVYPHEVRRPPTVGALAEFIAGELDRLWGLSQITATLPGSLYAEYETKVVPDRPPRRPWPKPVKKNPSAVFLHSSPRAGSTLFRVMLAGHPALFAPPELDILRCGDLSEWLQGLNDSTSAYGFFWATQGLQWAFIQLLGLTDETVKTFLDDLAAQGTPIHEVYARLQQLAGPRLLVDKSPQYSLRLDTLLRAEDLFESPKYLHLIRHPYAVIDSLVRVRLDKLFGPAIYGVEGVESHLIAEKVWVSCNRNLLEFGRRIDSGRYYQVRYEELVRDPARVMRGVCEFLDVPFDEAVLQPYDHRPERMISGLGDPNILRHDKVDAQLGEAWRKIKLPRPLGEPARRLAAELNYELPLESSPAAEAADLAQILAAPDLTHLVQNVERLSSDEVNRLLTQLGKGEPHETH